MSFLAGFADSMAGYFGQRAQADEERKDWEWKQKRLVELEKQRATGVELFDQGGQVMAQPVNAAGEPVGSPRAATQFESTRYQRGETEYKLKQDLTDLNMREAKAKVTGAEYAISPEARAREKEQHDAAIAASRANAGYMGVLSSNAKLEGEQKKMLLDMIKNGELPKEVLGGGRGGAVAKPDTAEDEAKVRTSISAVNEQLASAPPGAAKANAKQLLAEVQASPDMSALEKMKRLNRALMLLGASVDDLDAMSSSTDGITSADVAVGARPAPGSMSRSPSQLEQVLSTLR